MYEELATGFTQSPQGVQALQALQAQGFAFPQASAMLTAAVPAAAEAMRGAARGDRQMPSLGESSYVMNFAAAAVCGLIRGEGFMGSAMDGLQGIVGGYVAQVIAARFGLPKRVAGLIGAVITPLAIDFLWDRLAAGLAGAAPAGGAAPSVPAAMTAGTTPYAGYAGAGGATPARLPAASGYGSGPVPYSTGGVPRGYGYAIPRAPAVQPTAIPGHASQGTAPRYVATGYVR
ncbi:MAG: hypothetical protein JW751_24945 [Polyangiaceae bacterium]|nr:hypothetical protein [Polyangiaceae bacterium]